MSDNDLRFIHELPETLVHNIYIDFLFNEFIYQYNFYFRYEYGKKLVLLQDVKFRRFLILFLKNLEPRLYLEKENI